MRLVTLPGVFRPRTDSWLLAGILQTRVTPGSTVLDLCTGSGLLALAAAGRGASVVAVDVSRRAALTAWLNARLNGLRVSTHASDLFDALAGRRFDLIVSNPPYLPTPGGPPRRFSAARAWHGGPAGRETIDRICDTAALHLNPDGELLLVHSSLCGVEETLRRLQAHGLAADVLTRRRGPLGPLLASRVEWLRDRGLLPPDSSDEELAVVRGVRRHAAA